ncbi:MAG: hypothetical protein ABSC62_08110 [Terracidiphilus sp.]|jgi:hypothetical protein
MKKLLMVVSTVLLAASVCYAQPSANTATANLAVTVGNEAAIAVVSSSALTSTGTTFADYTSITDLTYWVRTTVSGTITVEITTDFSTGGPGGGPSVKTPPTSGDALTYTCSVQAPVTGLATACSTAQTASTSSATMVVNFGATTQSLKAGDDAKTMWTLTNDPSYAAGSYTAVATYTISAA